MGEKGRGTPHAAAVAVVPTTLVATPLHSLISPIFLFAIPDLGLNRFLGNNKHCGSRTNHHGVLIAARLVRALRTGRALDERLFTVCERRR